MSRRGAAWEAGTGDAGTGRVGEWGTRGVGEWATEQDVQDGQDELTYLMEELSRIL